MSGLESLAWLLGLFVLAMLAGFLVEAANQWGSARPYTEDELKALVRRHFKSPVPDDSEAQIALALWKDSHELG